MASEFSYLEGRCLLALVALLLRTLVLSLQFSSVECHYVFAQSFLMSKLVPAVSLELLL